MLRRHRGVLALFVALGLVLSLQVGPATADAPPPGSITGLVTDSAGHPLGGARVRLWGEDDTHGQQLYRITETTTGPDGSYTFPAGSSSALPDHYRVDAGHTFYEPSTDRNQRDFGCGRPDTVERLPDAVNSVPTIALPGDGLTAPTFHADGLPSVGVPRVDEPVHFDQVFADYACGSAVITSTMLRDGSVVAPLVYDGDFLPSHAYLGHSLAVKTQISSPADWDWYAPGSITGPAAKVQPAPVTDYTSAHFVGRPEVGQRIHIGQVYAGQPDLAGCDRTFMYIDGDYSNSNLYSFRLEASELGHSLSVQCISSPGTGFDPTYKIIGPVVIGKATPRLTLSMQQPQTAGRGALVEVGFRSPAGPLPGPLLLVDRVTGRELRTLPPQAQQVGSYGVHLPRLGPGQHRIVAIYAGDRVSRPVASRRLVLVEPAH